MTYAGFWERFSALIIDAGIFLPLSIFIWWVQGQSQLFYVYVILIHIYIMLFYDVYLVKRYGGTPGKLIVGIKIARLDGANVGYKEAMLRYVVTFITVLVGRLTEIAVIVSIPETQYYLMDEKELSRYILDNMPSWDSIFQLLTLAWVVSELVVMLTNKKRRALHDYIAGTVVIRKNG